MLSFTDSYQSFTLNSRLNYLLIVNKLKKNQMQTYLFKEDYCWANDFDWCFKIFDECFDSFIICPSNCFQICLYRVNCDHAGQLLSFSLNYPFEISLLDYWIIIDFPQDLAFNLHAFIGKDWQKLLLLLQLIKIILEVVFNLKVLRRYSQYF